MIWPWVAPGAFFIDRVDYRHALPIFHITSTYRADGIGMYGGTAMNHQITYLHCGENLRESLITEIQEVVQVVEAIDWKADTG